MNNGIGHESTRMVVLMLGSTPTQPRQSGAGHALEICSSGQRWLSEVLH
jgi:hypothetical protein